MGKLDLNTVVFVHACMIMLIHLIMGKTCTMGECNLHILIISILYPIFVCRLIFACFLFRQSSADQMALHAGTRWQCHHTFGPAVKVNMKVIPHILL